MMNTSAKNTVGNRYQFVNEYIKLAQNVPFDSSHSHSFIFVYNSVFSDMKIMQYHNLKTRFRILIIQARTGNELILQTEPHK